MDAVNEAISCGRTGMTNLVYMLSNKSVTKMKTVAACQLRIAIPMKEFHVPAAQIGEVVLRTLQDFRHGSKA